MKLYKEIFKLKNILRKGWVVRNVRSRENRQESDAEHCYSMIMLALEIMHKEKLDLDEAKVLKMVAFHELGEIDYGDHTPLDNVTVEEKFNGVLKCIKRIAKECDMPEIEELWLEFEENKTAEAQFVKKIDKLDAILQSKIYSEVCDRPELYEEFSGNQPLVTKEFEKYINKNSDK